MAIVRESHAHSVSETAKKYKVSEHTIYLWRKKFGGLVEGFVSYIMAGSTNFAVEITDAGIAAKFFTKENKSKFFKLFKGAGGPGDIWDALEKLSELDTGVTVYESDSDEVDFEKID